MVPALICVAAGQFAVAMYAPRFTLSWEHAVETVEWRETWKVRTKTMLPVEARIKGSGAGMEPPRHAVPKDGWMVYAPKAEPQSQLVLSDNGFAKPVRLCLPKESCRPLRAFLPREAPRDAPVTITVSPNGDCTPQP